MPINSSFLTVDAGSVSTKLTSDRTGRPRTARPQTAATTASGQEIICAITESRGISPIVGVAFVNITTSEAVLCQIRDSQTYARTVQKLAVYDPTEVLFMKTAKEARSKLFAIIEENLPQLAIMVVDRKFFAETIGHEYVERLAFKDDLESIKLSLEGNYYATCGLAAALSWVELELSHVFVAGSLRFRYEPSEGSMMIDISTIMSLELSQNLLEVKSKHCLFGILNETLTPMGSRLLRSNVLQPSTESSKLTGRYDAIDELISKEAMFYSVRKGLKSFVDADKVLTLLIFIPRKVTFQHAENSINNVIMLKTYLSSIKPVFDALTGATSSLLQAVRNLCDPSNYENITDMINSTINEDITYQTKPLDLRNQRTYAIKAGVNSLLDVARQTYKEMNNDVVEFANQLAEAHNLAIDLRFETGRQYYFRILRSDLDHDQLPEVFINVYRKNKFMEFQTLDLVKLNQKITDSHNEVINMSDRSIQELIDDIRPEISSLFRISEGIAMLDMLSAFAHLAITYDYVRPELTDTLAIKSGRHPIQERIHKTKHVPNDAFATQQSRFQIITGCNMSGKSTYIRSLALLTVMAQIGSFVPAQYASFPVVRKLFARISADETVEATVSTFSAEMRAIAFILRNISANDGSGSGSASQGGDGNGSMVIIDELGRGTSTSDGLAIAVAISEALVSSGALVWFTTHFHDLPRIMAERAGVVNLHLAVELSLGATETVDQPDTPADQYVPAPKMTMFYKIADGYATDTHYGLALARLLPFPPRMLTLAAAAAAHIRARADTMTSAGNSVNAGGRGGGLLARERAAREWARERDRALTEIRRQRLVLELRERLMQARAGSMGVEEMAGWLTRVQQEFRERMAALVLEEDEAVEDDGYYDEDESDEGEEEEGDEEGGDEEDMEEQGESQGYYEDMEEEQEQDELDDLDKLYEDDGMNDDNEGHDEYDGMSLIDDE